MLRLWCASRVRPGQQGQLGFSRVQPPRLRRRAPNPHSRPRPHIVLGEVVRDRLEALLAQLRLLALVEGHGKVRHARLALSVLQPQHQQRHVSRCRRPRSRAGRACSGARRSRRPTLSSPALAHAAVSTGNCSAPPRPGGRLPPLPLLRPALVALAATLLRGPPLVLAGRRLRRRRRRVRVRRPAASPLPTAAAAPDGGGYRGHARQTRARAAEERRGRGAPGARVLLGEKVPRLVPLGRQVLEPLVVLRRMRAVHVQHALAGLQRRQVPGGGESRGCRARKSRKGEALCGQSHHMNAGGASRWPLERSPGMWM